MVRVIVTAVLTVLPLASVLAVASVLAMTVVTGVLALRLLAVILTGVLIKWDVSAHGRSFRSCSS